MDTARLEFIGRVNLYNIFFSSHCNLRQLVCADFIPNSNGDDVYTAILSNWKKGKGLPVRGNFLTSEITFFAREIEGRRSRYEIAFAAVSFRNARGQNEC